MSINNANYGSGIIIFNGERLLIYYNHCDIKFENSTSSSDIFHGSRTGSVYLTSHRIVFISKNLNDKLKSISMPFVTLKKVDIKQPVFGANRVEGQCTAEPNGGFQGTVHFSITFKHGGAIEFGQALLEVGKRATRGQPAWQPTGDFYSIPVGASYYAAPPPTYAPPYQDPYYNFVPQHQDFSRPQGDQVFMYGAPPPYPGACPYPSDNLPSYNQGMPQPQMNGSGYTKEWEANQTSSQVPPAYYSSNNPHQVYAPPQNPSEFQSTTRYSPELPPAHVGSVEPSAPPPAYSEIDKKNK